jgi:hypothetical protein
MTSLQFVKQEPHIEPKSGYANSVKFKLDSMPKPKVILWEIIN